MKVPIFELSRQYKSIASEIQKATAGVYTGGVFTLGPQVQAFETEFAAYIGQNYAVGLSSGTDALTLAVRAMDLTSEDEVILPANAYPSAFGVALSGVRIRLADARYDGNMDPVSVDQAIGDRTRAVMPVHLYGNPADLEELQAVISYRKRKIYLIEDAAQAHGAAIKSQVKSQKLEVKEPAGGQNSKFKVQNSKLNRGKIIRNKVGSVGDIGCFSFYPTKNLGAYGDGGMIVTGNQKIADRVRQLRMYGESARYKSTEVSGISRLDELQAAILRVKLKHLDEWNRRRQEISKFYERELDGVGDLRFVSPKSKDKNAKLQLNVQSYSKRGISDSCHHLFVIRTAHRNELKEYLTKQEIGCAVHYPVPIHLTKAFARLGYKKGDFPVAEALSRQVLSLPLFPELTDGEAEKVTAAVKTFFRK